MLIPRKKILKLIVVFTASILLIEILLRLTYPLLPITNANGLGNKYKVTFEGIYNWDANNKMTRMKSNFQTRMFYNGYR